MQFDVSRRSVLRESRSPWERRVSLIYTSYANYICFHISDICKLHLDTVCVEYKCLLHMNIYRGSRRSTLGTGLGGCIEKTTGPGVTSTVPECGSSTAQRTMAEDATQGLESPATTDSNRSEHLRTDGGRNATLLELTGFQRDLLVVIRSLDHSSETVSGQRIKEAFQEQRSVDEVNHGRLYPNLDTLVERGYVAKGTADRRTNTYETTERGRNAIRARRLWLADADEAVTDGGDGR